MKTPSESIRDLATRLLAAESAARAREDPHEAVIVFEKLGVSMIRFAGADGFTSLARRSLAMAAQDLPLLNGITVAPGGHVEGLKEMTAADADGGADAAQALTVHLLWLLVTFIGEPITLRLVRESWPEVE